MSPPASPLRVLFYVETLDIGGANQTTLATALAMKRRGHHVLFASRGGPLRERLEKAGIPHFDVETAVRHPNPALARRLRGILDREQVDVACPNGWDCFSDMLLAALPRGIPVVPTFPSIYPEYHHPRVQSAIVFSGEYRDALIARYGWRSESLEMLIHRIDTERFRPDRDGGEMRRRWGLEAGTPVVFMACRMDAMKIDGVHFLLDAVKPLFRACPQARVVLAGDGELAPEVAERVETINRDLGCRMVILAGKVLEMERAFAASDIVVGNGARSAMEGMAGGRPVVSVGPSGFAGVFSEDNIEEFAYYNFDKGTVFDGKSRKDPEALSGALAELIGSPELRDRLGRFCREFAVQRLSVDAGAARLESLLRAQRRIGSFGKLRRAWELAAGVASFAWFATRRKLRKTITGSPGPSRAVFVPAAAPTGGFLRDSTTTFLTRVFCIGVGFVQVALTARILRPEGKGELASAVIIPQILVMIAPLGINFACTYFMGRKTFDREILTRTAMTVLVLLGFLGMGACLVSGYFLQDGILEGVSRAAFLLATLTIPTQLGIMFLLGLFRGEMRIGEANLFDAARGLLMLGLIMFFLLVLGLGVAGVLLGQVFADALVLAWGYSRFGGVRPVPLFRWTVLRSLLGYGLQVFSFSILLFLNFRLDLFLVRSHLDFTQTGLYSAAVTLAEILWIVPNSLGNVLFPSAARSSGQSRDLLTLAVCRRSFSLMLVLCGLLALTRHLAIRIVFGSEFLDAAPALLAILPGILAMSLQQVLGADLSGRGRPLGVTLAAGIGLAVNVVLNLLWIPRYGIVGASMASSVSYTLISIVVLFAFLRITQSRLRDALLLRREDLDALSRLLFRTREAVA